MKAPDRRILFIGQAPNRSAEADSAPFSKGYSATRLSRLMGLSVEEMLEKHIFINIFDEYPGKGDSNHPRGDHFPLKEARSRVTNVFIPLIENKQVVFLGRNVADSFKVSGDCYFEWISCARLKCEFAVSPHPSGVNTWWNKEANKQSAERFFRSLIT